MLFNLNVPDAGTVTVNGESIVNLTRQNPKPRVSLVPEDRMTYGIADVASIEENVISDRFSDKRFNKGLCSICARSTRERYINR